MTLSHDEIIKIIACELAYNRFLGMIARDKKNRQIESLLECEEANNLANENWFLYKNDAETLYGIISGKTEITEDHIEAYSLKEDCKIPSFDTSIGSLDL